MRKFLLLALTLGLAGAAQAEGQKPGLWSVTVQMSFIRGGPQISPEQQAMMQKMGINPLAPMTHQYCLTPELAKQEQTPGVNGQDGCETRNLKHSGNSMSADWVCDGRLKGKGQFQMTQTGNGYDGGWTFAGTSSDEGMAGPLEMKSSIKGQWLGADCGKVKPMPR
ncbi:MAG: DUF3617 domain-containing protein [Stagnimonas sp.]|nr:DUF3617 domain-containing protein [Stagnimonas sp.]